jgi:hypothetical protein
MPKVIKIPTWIWITCSIGIALILYGKWRSDQEKKNTIIY